MREEKSRCEISEIHFALRLDRNLRIRPNPAPNKRPRRLWTVTQVGADGVALKR